ncbi:hypothetical protein [Desulfosporosinus metallidurans]|uniref:Uncharacterized protein n=1 Tax=Desulfosporosinus metallidurans TaxID=1888891 RepID=A0A1Q8QUD2_9FIRM|nr:hypothetical protein [Desulfosporosinus metallidurans]OLN30973.1 hypothetical protein DSOL_2860 [Desulfosporosinus metallidurans]
MSNLNFTTIQEINQILTIYRTCISEPFHHNPIILPHGLTAEELSELESVYYTLTLMLYDLRMGDLEKKRIYGNMHDFIKSKYLLTKWLTVTQEFLIPINRN